MHKYVDCLKQDKGLAWPNVPSLKEEHYQEISSFRSPRKIIIVMEKIKGAFLNLYPMNICTLYLWNVLNERNFSGLCGRQRQGQKSVSFFVFRIYYAEVSGWGREFVFLCKCFKDKICMMSLLYVKYKSHNQYFHYSYERCIYTKDWVPVRLHN